MSVADKLEKLTTDIKSAYDAIEEKGGTIPEYKNTDSLPEAIRSIEGDTGFGIDAFLRNELYGMGDIDADRLQENMVYIGYVTNCYPSCSFSCSGLDFTATPYGGDMQLFGKGNDSMAKSIANGIQQVVVEGGGTVPSSVNTCCLQYDDRNGTWWGRISSGNFVEITPQKMEELGWRDVYSGQFWFSPNSEKITGKCQWALPDGYSSQYFAVIEMAGDGSVIRGYSNENYAEVDANTFKNEIFPQFFGNFGGGKNISLPGMMGDVTITTSQISFIIIGDGVADADLPQFPSGGEYFMSSCRYLFLFYGLDRILTHSGEVALGRNFLSYCQRFNQPIDLTNVKRIGHTFMQACSSFNQKLVIPENVVLEGWYDSHQKKYGWAFMTSLFSMCSEIEVNSPPLSEELMSSDSSLATYAGLALTRGIKITGLYRDAWLAKLPNKEGFRNLY